MLLFTIVQKSWLPATAVSLVGGLVWQTGRLDPALPAWAMSHSMSKASPVKPVAPAPVRPRVIAEGRVVAYPGAEVVVGTEASGRVVEILVDEKSKVRKGDLIAVLNGDELRASRLEAMARVAEAEADLRFYEREVHREESLLNKRAGTVQNLDSNRRGLEAAQARRLAALATRDRLDAALAKTRIVAPIDGVVTARHVQAGETVDLSARIVTIADLDRVRVEAEVDEFDTALVRLGSRVAITAEGYKEGPWPGRVEEVPDTVVGRRLRPEDPGRPIDARVLPVKIAFSGPTPLKLGQRVEVEISPGEGN
jgi:RND family efflux transporter MFP subunit